MAFPLMALGAGLGIAADDINKQAQLRMQQMKYAAELAQLRMALQQNQQKNQNAQDLAALSLPGGAPGGGDGGGFAAQPGPNNSPYAGSAGGSMSAGGATDAASLVKRYESQGKYNVGFGGTDLSNAPLDQYGFPQWPGAMGPKGISHAAGAYQFQPGTWDPAAAKLGIHDFSPASQDAVFNEVSRGGRDLSAWAPYNQALARALNRPMPSPPRGGAPSAAQAPQSPGSIQTDAAGSYRVPTTYGSQAADDAIFGRQGTGETQVAQAAAPGPQTATDAGSQMAMPTPPNFGQILREKQAQAAALGHQVSPVAIAAAATQEFNRQRQAFTENMQIYSSTRADATQRRIAAAQEGQTAARGLRFVTMPDGTTKEWHPGQPIPPRAKIGATGGPGATKGEQGAIKTLEITDKDGQVVFSGDARVTPNNQIIPLGSADPVNVPPGGKVGPLSQSGKAAALAASSVASSVAESAAALQNLMELPSAATAGITSGLQLTSPESYSQAWKNFLATKLTPEDEDAVAVSFQPIRRAVANIETLGARQGLVGLTKTVDTLMPKGGMNVNQTLRRYAEIRQIIDRNAPFIIKGPFLTDAQRAEMRQSVKDVDEAVPFTVSDVNKLQQNPSVETLKQFADKAFGRGAAGGSVDPASFKSADDVKAAYQAGKIDRDTATKALKERFGMQ